MGGAGVGGAAVGGAVVGGAGIGGALDSSVAAVEAAGWSDTAAGSLTAGLLWFYLYIDKLRRK